MHKRNYLPSGNSTQQDTLLLGKARIRPTCSSLLHYSTMRGFSIKRELPYKHPNRSSKMQRVILYYKRCFTQNILLPVPMLPLLRNTDFNRRFTPPIWIAHPAYSLEGTEDFTGILSFPHIAPYSTESLSSLSAFLWAIFSLSAGLRGAFSRNALA